MSSFLATPWTVAHQVPLSLRFSRQEYQSGLPWPPPRWSFTPRNQILIFTSPALAGGFFNTSTTLEVPVNNQFRSVTQSCPTLCDPHGLQHTRPPCPSPTPGAYSNSCPLSRWCHLTISSAVIPFSSSLQSFPNIFRRLFIRNNKNQIKINQFSSVAPLCPTLQPYELQHARPPCASPTPGVHSNSCPLSRWCHLTISSSVVTSIRTHTKNRDSKDSGSILTCSFPLDGRKKQ